MGNDHHLVSIFDVHEARIVSEVTEVIGTLLPGFGGAAIILWKIDPSMRALVGLSSLLAL